MKEDRRKYNGGNKNAGRKPKAEEIKKAEMMDSVGDTAAVYAKCYQLALSGDITAIRFWIEQRIGKAKESQDITIFDEGVKQFIVKGAAGHNSK